MPIPAPAVYLIRHGETAWSASGRHTSTTDIPLTENGRTTARRLQPPLAAVAFARVWTSPLDRARTTCEVAGLGAHATVDPDLTEWNYGEYEGLVLHEILARAPGWMLFRDGCPGGENAEAVGARADRVIARVRAADGDVAIFGHGHMLRVLAARWLALPPASGSRFLLDTATLSILSYYQDNPAVSRWNAPV